jgi:hypothetical protein
VKEWLKLDIPLSAGLETKSDPRALQPPAFSLLRDVEFGEIGGLQPRKPFSVLGDSPGGELRRAYRNGDEWLVFTKDTLYSRNVQGSSWVDKGTHLAIKTEEETAFATVGDQVACDRCELGGFIVYVWNEGTAGYLAVKDAATGAVVVAPYSLGGFQRMRLTALDTKILLSFWDGVTGIYCYALTPGDPTAALAGASTTVLTGGNQYYDVCKVPGADQAVFGVRRTVTTSYELVTVTGGLTVARATKARTCDGPIAVSCPPTGTHVQVVRGNGIAIQGDYVTISGFVDVFTAQAIGTAGGFGPGTIDQIAAAHRSVTDSSQYRCYVFFSSDESADSGGWGWATQYNWVDTGNNLGTADFLAHQLGVASRAFDSDGRVFLWTAFAGESSFSGAAAPQFRGQLQNSYFLYRDDATLHAKAAFQRAGGFAVNTGHLPSVQNTSGSTFSWCGVERQIIEIGIKQTGYGARAPRDITFTFDSDEARRCARLGQTMYIAAGGEVLQYDGVQLTEVGFHVYPWYFSLTETAGGSLAAGTYAVKLTWRWSNAAGEVDRSTTATVAELTLASPPGGYEIDDCPTLQPTHKDAVAVEVWRTLADPTDDSPFYLVTSKDPAVTSNPNRYLNNEPTIVIASDAFIDLFRDELVDADAAIRESNPENGSVLENLSPPGATIIAASSERLFLAGVAGDPHRVWYSKLRGAGEVAAFHDALTVAVPRDGGVITALAFLNETLIVFKETMVFALAGDGFDNLGGGSNYGPARLLSADCGAVSAESVALMPSGLLFKSSKGWYLLNRGWALDYVGARIAEFDDDEVVSVHVLETQHQVRCLTASRMLVLDYSARTEQSPFGQWAEWTITGAVSAAIWDGTYHYIDASGAYAEQATYTGIDYGLDVETAWIKLNDLQGAGSVRWLSVLGEYRGAHVLRVRLARDYLQDGSGNWLWYQDESWTPSPTVIGGPEQVRVGPSIPRCQAIKVRITALPITEEVEIDGIPTDVDTYSEAIKLTGLALEVGVDRGINRRLPVAQKVGT